MSNWPRHTGIAVGLTLAVSLAHAGQPGQVYKVYESPQKNFSGQQPDFELGTRGEKAHDKTGGVIAFYGGDGEFQRIDWFGIPADSPVPADSTEQHAYYHRLLAAFLQTHPNTILSERDQVIDGIPMFSALVSMPGG